MASLERNIQERNAEILLAWQEKNDHLIIAKQFLDIKSDSFIKNNKLSKAIEDNNINDVEIMLVDTMDEIYICKESALRCAAQEGRLEIVKLLIRKGADIHSVNDFALQYAVENNHIEVVKYLLENGADKHTDNNLAMGLAMYMQYTDLIEILA